MVDCLPNYIPTYLPWKLVPLPMPIPMRMHMHMDMHMYAYHGSQARPQGSFLSPNMWQSASDILSLSQKQKARFLSKIR